MCFQSLWNQGVIFIWSENELLSFFFKSLVTYTEFFFWSFLFHWPTFWFDIILLYQLLFDIVRNYGVPLHLIRELYETFRNFKIRIADYVRYRKMTSNMNDRFPDATPEELDVLVLDPSCCCLVLFLNLLL